MLATDWFYSICRSWEDHTKEQGSLDQITATEITLVPMPCISFRHTGRSEVLQRCGFTGLKHKPMLVLHRLWFNSPMSLNSSHWDRKVSAITTISLNSLNKREITELQPFQNYLYNRCYKDDKPNQLNYSTPCWKLCEKWSKSHTTKSSGAGDLNLKCLI